MMTTLKRGSTGDQVKVAQYLIGAAARNTASGVFDDAFTEKVKTWQSNHKLTADGIIGGDTWTTIAKAMPTVSTSKKKTSAASCAIQILLGGLTVDGIFGTKTKKAVAAFQSANKLSADGIVGQKTWSALLAAEQSGDKPVSYLTPCKHYIQWDSRWSKKKYSTHTSSQTIGNSGCGPTSMAMIIATWIDPNITPVEMCKLSVDHGYRTYNSGTSRDFMKFCFEKYDGFSKFVRTASIATLKSALQEGALAVCSMNDGDNNFWTSGGHFITARGFDGSYIYANDPNKSSYPRKQLATKFAKCMNEAMIFWKKEPEKVCKPVPEPDDTKNKNIDDNVKAIIDISKWNGTIDFSVLKDNVSMVIARATSACNTDDKLDEYANKMDANGIPFGVYHFSYAKDVNMAADEAVAFYNAASKYNPKFYVLDAEKTSLNKYIISSFAHKFRELTDAKLGCYVAHNQYCEYEFDTIRGIFDFVWIPRYGKNTGCADEAYAPKYDCDIWQYTDVGTVDGVKGYVDLNMLRGDKTLSYYIK